MSSGYSTLTTLGWLKVGSVECQAHLKPSSLETSLPIHASATLQGGPEHLRSVLRRGQRTEMLDLLGSLCRRPVKKKDLLVNDITVK